ncbi:hypothetical protein ACKWTF_008699 [Chironomus riparius]
MLAAYFNFVVILSFITAKKDKNLILYPIFLTNWNVILNGVSSGFSAVIVTQYYRNFQKLEEELKSMTAKLKTAWILSSFSVVLAVSISLIYWPLIYTGRDKGVNDALTHAGNAIVLFIDLFVNAQPPRYGHFVHQSLFVTVYCFFNFMYIISGGVNRDSKPYIYRVLNWKNNTFSALLFAVSTLLFIIFIHFVLSACIQLRIWIYEKLCQRKQRKKIADNAESSLDV